MRIGLGFDTHRLVEGRPLVLGGVRIPSERGLLGHSDADVLTHAIIDALLGAAALGDIGSHFPDTDPAYKDADSMQLLIEAISIVSDRGYVVGNVDATVVLERPRLRPHIDAMRGRLAEAMGVDVEAVSIKATTSETIGFIGRGEGVTAHAICLLKAR